MSSPGVTFNLTCGKGVTEQQKLTNLRLSSFAESRQMQQKHFNVSRYKILFLNCSKRGIPFCAHTLQMTLFGWLQQVGEGVQTAD